MKKWMSTGYLKSKPTGEVNEDKGIIEGVSVCTVGEAKGHGVNLDSEFVSRVAELGASKRQGLKARFGHPNMCSTALGTFIGRFKNFRVVEDQAKADLFLSNEAKQTPHGDLRSYVLGMAKNESDMFGTSIVFTPGREYRKNSAGEKVYCEAGATTNENEDDLSDEVFVELEELHACDAVDEPAANEGLFSKFSGETVAGQLTEFLDLNPEVWGVVDKNPSILETIAQYGDKMDEFINRYRAYRSGQKEGVKEMEPKETGSEKTAMEESAPVVPVADEVKEEKKDVAAEAVAVPTEPVPVAPVEAPKAEEAKEAKPQEDKQFSSAEFVRIADAFGNDVAANAVRSGGDYQSAQAEAFAAEKTKNEELQAKLAELSNSQSGGTPAVVTVAKKSAKLFNVSK